MMVALFAVTMLYAQKGKVSAAQAYIQNGDLESAETRLNDAFEHKKSADWPKTYIVAAELANARYKAKKDPAQIEKAYDYYMKALELDRAQNNRFEKEIKVALTFFVNEMTNAGIEAFNAEKFGAAANLFEKVLMINSLPMFAADSESVDTAIVYNTALAAYNAKDWERAAKYLKNSISLNYGGGDAVLLLDQVYANSNDSALMAINLQQGFTKYPEDDRILTQLINYYLETRQNDRALEYLDQAVEKDPDNATFYYARGVLNDQSKNYERAIADYKKAAELNPDYFDALYNLGVIYFNQGVEQMNVANDKTDFKEFEQEKKKADELFKKSLPYMERANEIKPEDTGVLESLKGLYYRFEMNDKYDQVKDKLDAIEGK